MVQRMISGLCTLYLDNSWSIPLLVQDAFTEITLQKIKIWKFSIDLNFQSVNFPTSWFPHWKLRHFRGEPPMKNPWIRGSSCLHGFPGCHQEQITKTHGHQPPRRSSWFHADFMVILWWFLTIKNCVLSNMVIFMVFQTIHGDLTLGKWRNLTMFFSNNYVIFMMISWDLTGDVTNRNSDLMRFFRAWMMCPDFSTSRKTNREGFWCHLR